ncbi:AfsR/SARP family transcriptional regulator [Flindersiella endophytica]
MQFDVLGTLRISTAGDELDLRADPQRRVLAVLLARAPEPVCVAELVDALWPNAPPRNAYKNVQIYISRLKRELGEPDLIIRGPAGYAICLQPGDLDAQEFAELARQAESARQSGPLDQAGRLVERALALWRGQPYSGVPGADECVLLTAEVQRLTELYLHLLEVQADIGLQLGRHADLLPRLSALVTEHPDRERFAALLMLALYRSGRQAEALQIYRSARDTLIEQHGVEPGAELSDLHVAMLNRDPKLGRQAGKRPAQLPPELIALTGREEELAAVLTAAEAEALTNGPTVVVIGGMAGVGKTTLAMHAAHTLAAKYAEGTLFLDLHGFTHGVPPVEPFRALDRLLRTIGTPPEQIPGELDDRAARWRSRMADGRFLILLDNAATAEQVRPLLPASSGCLVLVTSRCRLGDLDGAHPIAVDPMPPADAVALFTRIVGTERIKGEPEARVREVIELCGRLPLAIRLAATKLRDRSPWKLRDIARQLQTGRRSVTGVFDLSFQALSADQQRVFRLLGLHPGSDFDTYSAAALAGLELLRAEAILESLVDAHLLEPRAGGRYGFHDLLRVHAAERAQREESEPDQRQAILRLVGYYLQTAFTADRRLAPKHSRPIQLEPPPTDHVVHGISDHAEAIAWFEAEHTSLVAVQAAAASYGWDLLVWQLARTLNHFHRWRAFFHSEILVWRAGISAAERIGDPLLLAECHHRLGAAMLRTGQWEASVPYLRRAIALFEQAGDPIGQADTLEALSAVFGQRGSYPEAIAASTHALELFHSAGSDSGVAGSHNSIGWWNAQLGDFDEAVTHCKQALHLFGELGDADGQAYTLDSLGYAAQQTGRYYHSLHFYQRSLWLFSKLENTYHTAMALSELGAIYITLDKPAQAREAWLRALELYETQRRDSEAGQTRQHLERLGSAGDRADLGQRPVCPE